MSDGAFIFQRDTREPGRRRSGGKPRRSINSQEQLIPGVNFRNGNAGMFSRILMGIRNKLMVIRLAVIAIAMQTSQLTFKSLLKGVPNAESAE